MTGPDPLRGLRRSIEELPPSPGTFEDVVARAARRRRRRLATGAAAAALVVLAAGGGLYLGGTTGSDGVVPASGPAASAGPDGGTPAPAAPSPTGSAPTGSAPAGSTPTDRPAVPAGFEPRSVTFVGGGRGWLLGDTTTCGRRPCTSLSRTSLLRTDDYGATWYGGPAPVAALAPAGEPDTPGTIRDVRFADDRTGFAYGGALLVTHDGGATWSTVPLPDGTNHVADLAARSGEVFLVAEHCATGGAAGTACSGGRLYRIAPGASTPVRVAGWPMLGPDAALAVNARLVAVAARSTLDGVAYELYVSQRAGGDSPADRGELCGRGLGGLAAGAGTVLWAGCDGGAGGADVGAVVSTDAGAHMLATTAPPVGRGVASAAALDADHAVVTGQDRVAATSDGGATWRRVVLPAPTSPDLRLGFVGFTDDRHGYVIAGAGGPAGLWRTDDGGGTWTYVPFP